MGVPPILSSQAGAGKPAKAVGEDLMLVSANTGEGRVDVEQWLDGDPEHSFQAWQSRQRVAVKQAAGRSIGNCSLFFVYNIVRRWRCCQEKPNTIYRKISNERMSR